MFMRNKPLTFSSSIPFTKQTYQSIQFNSKEINTYIHTIVRKRITILGDMKNVKQSFCYIDGRISYLGFSELGFSHDGARFSNFLFPFPLKTKAKAKQNKINYE